PPTMCGQSGLPGPSFITTARAGLLRGAARQHWRCWVFGGRQRQTRGQSAQTERFCITTGRPGRAAPSEQALRRTLWLCEELLVPTCGRWAVARMARRQAISTAVIGRRLRLEQPHRYISTLSREPRSRTCGPWAPPETVQPSPTTTATGGHSFQKESSTATCTVSGRR